MRSRDRAAIMLQIIGLECHKNTIATGSYLTNSLSIAQRLHVCMLGDASARL